MSTIERGYNLPTDNFTIVPNTWARDRRLSRRARGLLIELMSHRAGWTTSVAALAKTGTEGEAAIKSAIKELETIGYLERHVVTDKQGRRDGIRYVITNPPEPENPSSDPSGENRPMDDDPSGENRPMDGGETAGRPSGDFPPVDDHPTKKNTLQEKHSFQEEENQAAAASSTELTTASASEIAAAAADLEAQQDKLRAEIAEKTAAAEKTLIAMNVDLVEAGVRAVSLNARFGKLTAEHRAEISALVQAHGVPALVKAAQLQHQPDSPARFAQAWLPAWRELRTARPASAATTSSPLTACTACDEYGWVLGDLGAPIDPPTRCTHTRRGAA
ncbi:helix-turn-helix domain-containing protein [Rhodococcus zopfii]|uniref:helix-turn-helix domain-containing protein n=1 Tax=Rhodococcus zopfii TaxID=43772 RepID=UPI003528B5BE